MRKLISRTMAVGFVGMLGACSDYATYDEVALCETATHQRVDEDYCYNTSSNAVSWVFVSMHSDYSVGSYGQYIDPNRVSRTPTGNVSYGGLRGSSNVRMNTVQAQSISGKSYSGAGIARGGLGVSGGGKSGGS